jgi:hypothetical protein
MILLLPVLATGWFAADVQAKPIKLELVDYRPEVSDFYVVDLDGDDDLEFIEIMANGHQFMPREFSTTIFLAQALSDERTNLWISGVRPIEVDPKAGSELAILMKDYDGDSCWIAVLSGSFLKDTLCVTQAVHGTNLQNKGTEVRPGWDGRFTECFSSDLDHDGRQELIAVAQAGYDCMPRGVYVYDYPSGQLQWSFPTAGEPQSIEFADADNDGRDELYFQTGNPNHGCTVGDMVDTTSYLFAVDHDGTLMWREQLDAVFDLGGSNILVGDYDHNDTVDIYYCKLLLTDNFDQHLQVLRKCRAVDNKLITQHVFEAGDHFDRIEAVNLTRDLREELIVGQHPGLLNPVSLEVVKQAAYDGFRIEYLGDIDVSRRPAPEIVLSKRDSILVLNNDFNERARTNTRFGEDIRIIRHFRDPFNNSYLGVLVTGGDTRHAVDQALYIFRIEETSTLSLLTAAFSVGSRGWFVIGLAFVLGILMTLLAIRPFVETTRSLRRRHTSSGVYENILDALTTFSHGRMAAKNLNRVGFLFKNLPDSPEAAAKIRPNLNSAVEAFQSFTCGQLYAIANRCKRLHDIKTVGRQISQDTALLCGQLSDFKGKGPLDRKLVDRRNDIAAIVARVQANISTVRRTVESHFSARLLTSFRQVLATVDPFLEQQGVAVTDISIRGDYRIRVFFTEPELSSVFEELINNACTSMAKSTTRHLAVAMRFDDDHIYFTLADTGTGFDDNKAHLLFDRDYSTKEDTGGYGLFNVKQLIERFGGRISIINNPSGVGATVDIKFKTVHHE